MKGRMIVKGPYRPVKAFIEPLDNLPSEAIINRSQNIDEDTLVCRMDIFFADYDIMVQSAEQMGYEHEPTTFDGGISLSLEKW